MEVRRKFTTLATVLAVTAASLGHAWAQSQGTITLLVGYSAGGSADLAARTLAPGLSGHLGRTVVVENATGASGMIALQKLINSKADGATLYYGGQDTVAVPMLNAGVGVDWKTDTIPVGRTTAFSMSVVVPAASPYATLQDLVAAAQAAPETLTYGSPGIGSAQHLVGEMISHAAGVTMVHVPYQGGAQVATDLLGGMLDSAVLSTSTARPFLQEGQVRALALTSEARSPLLPDVPALGEIAGFEGMSLPLFHGIFVKAGTDPAFVAQLTDAIDATLAQPDVQQSLADAGFTASSLNGAEFVSFVDTQAELYKQIITDAQITME